MKTEIIGSIKFKSKAILGNGTSVALDHEATREDANEYSVFNITIHGRPDQDLTPLRLELFSIDLRSPSVEVFRQGFYMPSDPTGFYVLKAGKDVPPAGRWKPDVFGPRDFISHSVVVMKIPGTDCPILVGFTSFNRFNGYFRFDTSGRSVRFSIVYDIGLKLPAGTSLHLESFMIVKDKPFHQCLELYTDYVARTCHARVPRRTVTGWSDWQYYREEKNEKDILTSVAAMKPMVRQGFPLKYIIVDGGWCAYASEWMKPCEKFPGMPRFSRRLRKEGFELGIWLAPYLTNVKTEVARRHPEWMVIDEKTGKPLHKPGSNVGPCYMLDFTIPAALEWLRKIVRIMVRDWKIGYLKLDGPCLAHYHGGRFHNPGITAIEQVRKSLEVIREECGEKVIVEGEGIYGPSIGFVDTQRTTQDNHPMWWYMHDGGKPMMKENMKNDLLSAFMHGRFWHNHRENVILRDFPSPFHAGKENNPNLKELILPLNELLFQLSVGVMAGGAMLLTDPMHELCRNPDNLALISQFLPHYESDSACHPLDVFLNGQQPSIYTLKIDRDYERWHIVGIFNWDDFYQNFRVPLSMIVPSGAWHGFDFWNERYLGCFTGGMKINDVPAHGCKIIALRAAQNHPQLLGTNLHVFQGAVDIRTASYEHNRLRIEVDHFYQKDRKLFFWRPDGFKIEKVRTNAVDFLVDARARDFCTIYFNGKRRTFFDLTWGK